MRGCQTSATSPSTRRTDMVLLHSILLSALAAVAGASYITGPGYIYSNVGNYQTAPGSYSNSNYDWYATSNCPKISTTFSRGASDTDTGGQVSNLQQFLATHYVVDPLTLVSGRFGPATQHYIIQFQRDNGIPPSGAVDLATLSAIFNTCGGQSGNNQGQAIIPVYVSNAPTCTLSIIPTSVYAGQVYSIYWYTTNATNAYLSGYGPVPSQGTYLGRNTGSGIAEYQLSVSGPGGSASCSTSVTIGRR